MGGNRARRNDFGGLIGMIGETPKNCMVFEDSKAGVQSAKNAGMKVAGLSLPLSPKQDL